MKPTSVFFAMASMMLIGTACGDSDNNKEEPSTLECTASNNWKKCIDDTTYSQCIGGIMSQGACMTDEICQNDGCVKKITPQPVPCSPDGVKCEGNELVTCAGGMETRRLCVNGCKENACVESSQKTCSFNGVQCDGADLVICAGGVESRQTCANGCANNKCNSGPETSCSPDGLKCDGAELVMCSGGIEMRQTCAEGCSDNKCNGVPQTSCSPDGVKCDGTELVMCSGGIEMRQVCAEGCSDNKCNPPQTNCSPDGVKCDGDELVTCAGGVETRQTCLKGCRDNACVAECGNHVREGNEVCDGEDLGVMTCRDLSNAMQTANYSGMPVCNSTCDGIEEGTCEKVFCGNNILDVSENEFCDIVDGESKFLNPVSCNDIGGYEGKEWMDGGKPECSADCRKLKNGTCKLKPQPMGGIETCHFDVFNNDVEKKEVSGHLILHTVDGVTLDMIDGQLVCGNPTSETYTWKGEAARFQECEDCEANEFRMVSEVSYAKKYAGTYGCVFQARIDTKDIDGNTSTSYYNCPKVLGYPYDLKILPDENIMYTFDVSGETLEGTVLAHWDFSQYKKDEANIPKKIIANDGVMKSLSEIRLSDDSEMRMLTGTGDYPEAAVSGNNWPQDETISLDSKHFIIQSSATGYKNIRFQFMVSESGVGAKHVETAYKSNGNAEWVGNALTLSGGIEFQQFPLTSLDKATDVSSFEVDVYTYGASDSNMTMRLDDIYILGDALTE